MRCDVIKDLIPLYEEDLCSQASRELVEEHVRDCADCRGLLLGQDGLSLGEVSRLDGESRTSARDSGDVELNRKGIRPFRKVKRAYNLRILAALLLIPVLVFTYAEVSGNSLVRVWKGKYLADRYFSSLVAGDYDKAAQSLDFGGGRYGREGVPLEDARESYEEALGTLEGMGIRFASFDTTPEGYSNIRNDDGFASGYVEVTTQVDSESHRLLFWVSAQGKKLDIGWIQERDAQGVTGDTKLSDLLGDYLSTYYPG